MRCNNLFNNNSVAGSAHYTEIYDLVDNPLRLPALHYALALGDIDLAKEAYACFPHEVGRQSYDIPYADSRVKFPAGFEDLKQRHGWTVRACDLAALHGDEEFALKLLREEPARNRHHYAFLQTVCLRRGQSKLLNECYNRGYPGKIADLAMTDDLATARVVLFHHLHGRAASIDQVPTKLVETAMKYSKGGITPLLGALRAGDYLSFSYMLECGLESPHDLATFEEALRLTDKRFAFAMCNGTSFLGYGSDSKLLKAVLANDLEVVKKLDPFVVIRERGMYPVTRAYESGHKDMVRLLLDLGIGRDDHYILIKAIRAHDQKTVDYLLDTGYCPCWKHYDVAKAAVQSNEAAILQRLLSLGYTMNPLIPYKEAIVYKASDVFNTLINLGHQPTHSDYHYIVEHGHVPEMKALLEKFHLSAEDLSYYAELAAKHRQPEMFRFLTEKIRN